LNPQAHIAVVPKPISPAALLQVIRLNARRRPLWKPISVMDFLDLDYDQVMAKIQSGDFSFAFDIGLGTRSAPRILAISVLEHKLGPLPDIGATRDLKLPEVINLVLPCRDIRSTELKGLFSCDSQHVHRLKKYFRVARKPQAADGPNSYTVFHRASVETFLAQRRMA
jgi:hypothetical protein